MNSVVLLSGGIDSTVLLAWVRNHTDAKHVYALTVDYGQRHRRELWSAFQVARYYGATDVTVTVAPALLAGSSLTGTDGKTSGADTVVPGRNLLLLSMAISEAVRRDCQNVYIASHGGDRDIYPDCRWEFLLPLASATVAGYGVSVEAPFLSKTKRGVVKLGIELSVPFDLTWSCYAPVGHDPNAVASGSPCRTCRACKEREAALA